MRLIAFLLLLPVFGFAQGSKQLTPTGAIMRISPFTSLSGSSEQDMYRDTIPAKAIQKFNKVRFSVKSNISTGVSLSNLTLKFVSGSNTVTLINALGIGLSMTNKPCVINGEITNQGNGTALLYIVVSQDGSVINSVSTYYATRRIWTMDFESDQIIALRAQITGLGLGATTIGVDEIETQGF